jgi:hypothetical protein
MPASPEQTSATRVPPVAAGGVVERALAAPGFVPQARFVAWLAAHEVGDKIEIEAVAHHAFGRAQGVRDFGRAPGVGARTDPDNVEMAARRADQSRVEGPCRERDRAGCTCGFSFGNDETARRPDACKRCRFGNRRGADRRLHIVGFLRHAIFLGAQVGRCEKPRRHAKRFGDCQNTVFVGFEVDRRHQGDRRAREPRVRQTFFDQGRNFAGIGAAFAPDADRQHRRMIDECGVARVRPTFGDADIGGCDLRARQCRQKRRLAFDANVLAGNQSGRDGFDGCAIGDAPTRRRLVERHAQNRIACGGDRGRCAQRTGDFERHPIGAAMAAQQRDHVFAVGADGNDGRFVLLVAKRRRKRANKDSGRAEPDDRPALREQSRQMRAGIFERDGGIRNARPVAMHFAREAAGEGSAFLGQADKCWDHVHALPRRCTRTSEK